MGLKQINYYAEGRVFEWAMGISMMGVAFEILLWPRTIDDVSFFLALMFMNKPTIVFILLVIGWSRCAALMLNGQSLLGYRVGPMVRAVGSVISAFLWSQFAITLFWLSIERGSPSPGLPFWIMFTLAELYAAYTTVKNGRSG